MSKRITILYLLLGLVVSGSLSWQASAAENAWFDTGKSLLDDLLDNTDSNPEKTSLSNFEITDGLKETLRIGTERVVAQLGQMDGFNADKAIHIPLPSQLNTVKSMLNRVGMGDLMNDLEVRLNRAAEAATPEARALFLDAIKEMSFEDARRIYNGSDDAATQYLREKMSGPLGRALRPIIENSLAEVGAVRAYDNAMARYQNIPFVPDAKTDLTDHTVAKSLDGIFYYLGREEMAIRQDPLKRSTEILRSVFGN